jgi:hypothetical protein
MAFPVEQNILLDAGGYAVSKDDSALTEEDVYELANRYMAFVSDNLTYIDPLTEFAHTTGNTVALAVGGRRVDHVGGQGPARHRFLLAALAPESSTRPARWPGSEAAGHAGPDPAAWCASATKHRGSWREDRTTWPGPRAGTAKSRLPWAAGGTLPSRMHGRDRGRAIQVRQTDSIGGTSWVI